MKTFVLLAAILAFGFTLATADAQATNRLGAGKSSGMQRQATVPDKSSAGAAATAPSAAKAPPAAAAATPPKSSWMGPLAGLAAGLGIAALAAHFGFGEALGNMLMIGLLVMAVVVAIGFFMRRRAAAPAASAAGMGGMQYANADANPVNRSAHEMSLPASGSGGSVLATAAAEPAGESALHSPTSRSGHIPADFDAAGFERNAKVNFIRLQAANDSGNIEDIRAFTVPEMFAEIRMNISERGTASQVTDVINLEASVIDVAEEDARYVVSVCFSGLIRENNEAAEALDEIWHMVKPRDGSSGWLLAGIQQVA